MKFYQACYGKPSNNWELFNVSPDASVLHSSIFEKHGKACTPENIGVENTVNSDGSNLCLYEIIPDEKAVCILRAQYGERDNFGRPKMFAHGFVLEGDNVLSDPSSVLTISDDNFNFSTEATRVPPAELIKRGNFSLDQSLSFLGIDAVTHNKLMASIYLSLSSSTDFPLYVKCKNDTLSVRHLIYCILSSLPYSLRYHLSFSNANSFQKSRFKSVMFVDRVPGNEYYFSLDDCATNLNVSELYGSPEKHRAFSSFEKSAAEYDGYCAELSQVMSNIGCPFNAGYEDVNMADLIMKGTAEVSNKDDISLTRYLLELLTKVPYQNLFVDEYIADVLSIFDEKHIILNDTVMKRVMHKIVSTQSQRLKTVARNIKVRFLIHYGLTELTKFLNEQRTNSDEAFDNWCNLILSADGGTEAITEYYEYVLAHCSGYRKLYNAYAEAHKRGLLSKGKISLVAKKRLLEIAKENITPKHLNELKFADTVEDLKNYLQALFSSSAASIFQEYFSDIKKSFWDAFQFEDFIFAPQCIENLIYLKDERENYGSAASRLVDLYKTLGEYYHNRLPFSRVSLALDRVSEEMMKFPEEYVKIAPVVQNFVRKAAAKDVDKYFDVWVKVAAFGDHNSNPLEKMVLWELPVICSEEAFIADFETNNNTKHMHLIILDWMIGSDRKGGVVTTVTGKSDVVKAIHKEAKYISDYKKQVAAQEKIREKEQRKAEKKKNAEPQEELKLSDTKQAKTDKQFFEDLDESNSRKKGLFGFFEKKKK